MAIQSNLPRSGLSLVHWPIVGVAGALAGLAVFALIATLWAAGRSPSSARKMTKASPTALEHKLLAAVGEPPAEEYRNCGQEPLAAVPCPATVVLQEDRPQAVEERSPLEAHLLPNASRPQTAEKANAPVLLPGQRTDRRVQNEPACETYGTSVEFARNPTEAARLAKQERKLMLVLHIAGNFEESKFT